MLITTKHIVSLAKGGGTDKILRKWKIMQDSHPDAHKKSCAVLKLDLLRIYKH
jgi:hypothetical protein